MHRRPHAPSHRNHGGRTQACPFCQRLCQRIGPWGLKSHLEKPANHFQGCPQRPEQLSPTKINLILGDMDSCTQPMAESDSDQRSIQAESSPATTRGSAPGTTTTCPYCSKTCKGIGPWGIQNHLSKPSWHFQGCKGKKRPRYENYAPTENYATVVVKRRTKRRFSWPARKKSIPRSTALPRQQLVPCHRSPVCEDGEISRLISTVSPVRITAVRRTSGSL